MDDIITAGIAGLIEAAHSTAIDKGWWSAEREWIQEFADQYQLDPLATEILIDQFGTRDFLGCLALIDSETAETTEEYRVYGLDREKMLYRDSHGKPCGIAAELADVLIRVGDLCGQHDIPLAAAIHAKLEYNATRPHRHGKLA
jgi:NTP pyrophosphatase (non-canonical NTP hydrolase)